MGDGDRRGTVLRWLMRRGDPGHGTRLEDFDPAAVQALLGRLDRVFSGRRAWFPTEVEGAERIPPTTALVVGNHSGGTSIPDVWSLGWWWYRHVGIGRPLSGLAHELVFALAATARPFASYGMLRASPGIAEQALRAGRDLVVLPGGEIDTWRPFRDRHRVTFDGRLGYARLAIRAGVPILPVAHQGAHHTLVVLTDGRRLARKLHFRELFRAEVFPVHLSFPWGLAVGPMPHLPPPTRMRWRVAEPVEPPVRLAPDEPVPDEAVRALDAEVRRRLQLELDVLAADEPGWAKRLRRRR